MSRKSSLIYKEIIRLRSAQGVRPKGDIKVKYKIKKDRMKKNITNFNDNKDMNYMSDRIKSSPIIVNYLTAISQNTSRRIRCRTAVNLDNNLLNPTLLENNEIKYKLNKYNNYSCNV